MNQMRRFASKEDLEASIEPLFTSDELKERATRYKELSPATFAKKERALWARPVTFHLKGKTSTLQLNKCTNPFCVNYGLLQEKFHDYKGKPSRYKIVGGGTKEIPFIECTIHSGTTDQPSLSNKSILISNWSVAEEIIRLTTINSVVPNIFELSYHHEGCQHAQETPRTHPKSFYKRGKSKVGTQRYQSKTCKKTTNEQPKQNQSFSYHQQRHEEVFNLFHDMMNRTPVVGTLRKNNIGAGTYYHKMEWIYRKCLEFLERHETTVLENKEFSSLYLNTDALLYHLNYKRLKSNGSKIKRKDDKLPTTHVYTTADVLSGYIFRADVAYDFNITLEEIEQDTHTYFCDHTASYLRKNERLYHEYAPQPPTPFDNQTDEGYQQERSLFEDKENYVSGLHVKSTYTCLAHFWLLKQSLKAKNYYFVTDQDTTIQSAIHRIFSDEIKSKQSHIIACQVDKSLTLENARSAYFKHKNELNKWANDWGFSDLPIGEQVRIFLEEELAYHEFYEEKVIDGVFHPYAGVNPLEFPYPFMDEGNRYLTCLTDTREMEIEELAKILSRINGRAIDDFFQKIHRSISVLERPLTTARGDGKSYVYSNYNPKYAQYLITILRVYYNFCLPNKRYGEEKTPAQRLGITDKVFTIKDIIYFK